VVVAARWLRRVDRVDGEQRPGERLRRLGVEAQRARQERHRQPRRLDRDQPGRRHRRRRQQLEDLCLARQQLDRVRAPRLLEHLP